MPSQSYLNHLPDQLMYTFKRSVRKTVNDVFQGSEFKIKIAPDYEETIKKRINKLRDAYCKIMPGNNSDSSTPKYLDSHKLVAISCIAIMRERPFSVVAKDPYHLVNEIFAYVFAMDLLREHQLYRYCAGDKTRISAAKLKIKDLANPNLIHDKQQVGYNTIISLGRLALEMDKKDEQLINFAPLLASFFFYVDTFSKEMIIEAIESSK